MVAGCPLCGGKAVPKETPKAAAQPLAWKEGTTHLHPPATPPEISISGKSWISYSFNGTFLILGAFLLRKNSAFRSNFLHYASQITLVPPLPLLLFPFSFFPFTFYLFAGAIRVALISVLKS
jgi:hypothetical protein